MAKLYNAYYSSLRWFSSTNHKDIGVFYFIVGVWAVFISLMLSLVFHFGIGFVGFSSENEYICSILVFLIVFL